MPNPIWTSIIASTMQKHTKTCPHCKRKGVYPEVQPGRFHTCKHCGRRFIEKKGETQKGKD